MGVDHAAWAILGAVIRDTEEPEFRSFVVPRRDLEIDPGSWEVTGLRGAGSGRELPGLPGRLFDRTQMRSLALSA